MATSDLKRDPYNVGAPDLPSARAMTGTYHEDPTVAYNRQQMQLGKDGGFVADPAALPAKVKAYAARGGQVSPAYAATHDISGAQPAVAPPAPAAPGLARLPPGVTRTEIPGVYSTVGKDGSLSFSNIMGPGGPRFASGSAGRAISASDLGPTYSNEGAGPGGFTSGFDPATGLPIAPHYAPMSGLQRQNAAALLTGGSMDGRGDIHEALNADRAFPQNAMGVNPSSLIAAAGVDPGAAQAQLEKFDKYYQQHPPKNADEAAMDNMALEQLAGNVLDKRRLIYGSNGGLYGGMGGAGLSRGTGGLKISDILAHQDRQAVQGERIARDQDTANYHAAMTGVAQQNSARQSADDFMTRFNNAKTPQDKDLVLSSVQPPDDTAAAIKWFQTPLGQAWMSAAQSEARTGAASSLYPIELGDKADLNKNVNFGQNLAQTSDGRFAGFTDADGDVEYPVRNALSFHDNYDPTLVNLPPKVLQALKYVGLRRNQPVATQDDEQ